MMNSVLGFPNIEFANKMFYRKFSQKSFFQFTNLKH